MTKQYTSLSNDAMSTAEWAIANAKVDEIMDVARNKSSLQWFMLVDDYYEDEILDLKDARSTAVDENS